MFILLARFSSLSCVIVKTDLNCSGTSTAKLPCCTGHWSSGNFKKSGPFCQVLSCLRATAFWPGVIQSAIFSFPGIQYQLALSVSSCISPMRTTANELKPYVSFWIIALTISESTIKYSFWNENLHSLFINFRILAERTAPHNSDLTDVILRSGVTQFFDIISLLQKDRFCNSQRIYAHDPKASSDPSLNIINDGFPVAMFGFKHLWNGSSCIWNISQKKFNPLYFMFSWYWIIPTYLFWHLPQFPHQNSCSYSK